MLLFHFYLAKVAKVSPGSSLGPKGAFSPFSPFLSFSPLHPVFVPFHHGGWGVPTTPDMNGLKAGQGAKAGNEGMRRQSTLGFCVPTTTECKKFNYTT